MQAKQPSKQPSPFHKKAPKQPSKFAGLKPNPNQVSIVNPDVERILIAAVYGRVGAWNPEKPDIVTQVMQGTGGSGHIIYGWYEPIFDEVRVHPEGVSALAAAGVNWRTLTSILTNMLNEEGQTIFQLSEPKDCQRVLSTGEVVTFAVGVQLVVLPVDAIAVAIKIMQDEAKQGKRNAAR